MQTSIDRSYRRSSKRRKALARPDLNDLLRRTKWLTWPLIHWRGPFDAAVPSRTSGVPTLHRQIVDQLRTSSAGLFALQSQDMRSEVIRLLAVTPERLAAACHDLALAEKAEADSPDRGSDLSVRRQRLHALSKCLRDLERLACAETPTEPHYLRKLAWTMNGQSVLPPLEIVRRITRYGHLALPIVGRAIMEYALRSEVPQWDQFLGALEALVCTFSSVDREAERRRGLFASLIKAALQVQPAYVPVTFTSSSGGVICKWRTNALFLDAAVHVFFREYLQPPLARELAVNADQQFPFERISAWILGVEMVPYTREQRPASAQPPDVIHHMFGILAPLAPVSSTDAQTELAHLAACITLLAGDPDAPRQVMVWLAACRQWCQAAVNGVRIWERALECLENWLTTAQGEEQDLQRLLQLLETRSTELFAYGFVRLDTPATAFRALARLGVLTQEEAEAVVDHDLITIAGADFCDRPHQLAAFAAFVARHHHRWNRLQKHAQGYWIELFAQRDDVVLLRLLASWVETLVYERKFTLHDVTSFAWDILEFLRRGAVELRASRESFLRRHRWVLDQLLGEVEQMVATIPTDGYENWLSHGRIWTRLFGVTEILYEWDRAGFTEGKGMLDAVLAVCREHWRVALRRKDSYPPCSLDGIRGFEFFCVHISGGRSKQLTAFLDYYLGYTVTATAVAKGWCFLDRYPKIQETLRALCSNKKSVEDVCGFLDDVALAVRLKCDALLSAGLEEWMMAQDKGGESIEMLRGLHRLAGHGDGLPEEVERVIGRERLLRGEWAALAQRRCEGRDTASSNARFDKLARWLENPAALADWVAQDLHRLIVKRLPGAKMKALRAIAKKATSGHWDSMFGSFTPANELDWENARRLYYTVDKNQGLMRKLLRRTVVSGDDWHHRHAPNQKFRAEFEANGLDYLAWEAPFRLDVDIGGEIWTVEIEQDPLRVLQMGNWFGTCLSVGSCNAFSTIANAVELNKRVLYLKDSRGTVIGRKLIVITSCGCLFGYRSYGAGAYDLHLKHGQRSWVKILFDLASLQIARRAKGRLAQRSETDPNIDRVRLSAEWYDDGTEPFDWWIAQHNVGEAICCGNKDAVAAALLKHIHEHGLDSENDEWQVRETMRALLWLGDDAATVVRSLGANGLPSKFAHFLERYSPSEAVRALLQSGKPETLMESGSPATGH